MEAIPARNKETKIEKHALNLGLLEEKVIQLIDMIKILKDENVSLKNKNKDLHSQLKSLEGSLVAETKGHEELSHEKMIAKIAVDNLLDSIDALIQQKEK